MRTIRLLSLLAVLGTACGDPNATATTIQVLDDQFSPQTYTTRVGSTVTWVWNGQNEHDVRFSDGGGSSDIQTNGQYDRKFLVTGTFNYLCTIHPGMVGSVVVQP